MTEDLLSHYGLEPQPIEVFDSSILKDFINCPSMGYLKHILGLRPRDARDSIPLDWGSQWHKGLYRYYAESDDPAKGNLEAGLQAIADDWPSHIDGTDKYKRSRDRMLRIFCEYETKWLSDNKLYTILRHEQFFDVEDRDIPLRWCGRMDSIRRKKSPSKIAPWDYKTTSAMGSRYFDQFELSFQFPGYVWASDQMMTDEIIEIRVDVLYTLSKSHDFFRRTFRYDAFRKKEWVSNVKMWIDWISERQERYLYDPEMWMKNWDECTRYSNCMFFPVHSIHPKGDTRLRILQDDYIIDRWDPSAMGDDES